MAQPQISPNQLNISGWNSVNSEIINRGDPNAPPFNAITGIANIRAHEFDAAARREVWAVANIQGTYKPNTDILFHVHWLDAAATPNTGNVKWNFHFLYGSGNGTQPYRNIAGTAGGTTTVSSTQAVPATQWTAMHSEVLAGFTTQLSPDSIIYYRVFRDPLDVDDTCTDSVWLLSTGIHYQVSGFGAPNQ